MMLCVARLKRAGFTLIEIMIVIAIIAILAGIVVPNFMQARAESQAEACLQNCITIGTAIETALVRHSAEQLCRMHRDGGGWTGMWDSDKTSVFQDGDNIFLEKVLVENGYLAKVVTCPLEGNYLITYNEFRHLRFDLHCPGRHKATHVWPGYLQGVGGATDWYKKLKEIGVE